MERSEQQLDLLRRMADLDPPPFIMGGYAEDALIGGVVSRAHEDVDWFVPRSELDHRIEQARGLGFTQLETWGESRPGEPFYLSASQGALSIDIGVCDEIDGGYAMDIGKLMFLIDGEEPPAGFRVHLPDDSFDSGRVELEGIPVWPASPLCLYQTRIGIASWGAFGELNDKQRASLSRLKQAFYPERSDDELMPTITPLSP